MIKFPRRDFLKASGAVGAAGLLSAFPNGAFAQNKPDRITVTSYGGVWETAIRDYFVADFKKRTGVDADVQLGNPNQWISQVKASPNKPPLDAVVATADLIIEAGRAGLLDNIDGAKLANLKDVDKRFVDISEGWGV
ncbi:MAG: substrate-binding domain-containing protein, partial [Variibacter sp.]